MAADFTSLMPASDLHVGRTADIATSEKVFDNLEKHGQLSGPGRHWLETAIDPFHDSAMFVEGQPSYDQANTIVQVIKLSRTFTSSQPFDIHIANLSIDTNTPDDPLSTRLSLIKREGNVVEQMTDGAIIGELGFITVAQKDKVPGVESRLFPDEFGPPDPGTVYHGMSPCQVSTNALGQWVPSTNFCKGLHRVVAAGFEIINTTPILTAGGLTTVYRQAARSENVYVNTVDPQGVTNPYCEAAICRGPPATQTAAMLLPDSRQWRGVEGAYVVLTQGGMDNPFVQPSSRLRIFEGKDSQSVSDNSSTFSALSSNAVITSTTNATYNYYANNTPTPFHTSGCLMSLPANSEITVNVRIVMERAPTLSEPDLVVLMRPSPAYDELAWRFYSEAARNMPPGVPLNENFTGEWFRNVAATIKKTAVNALPVVKHVARAALPLAGPKGMAVSALINRLENKKKTPSKKSPTKKKKKRAAK